MYIRNAQGQLMWIPPHGFTPATQMAQRQAIQHNVRHQIQREEWDRFNAPPPEDNLYFQGQYSCYDGSLPSNGYNSYIAPAGNIPMIANRGSIIYRGQQPYNQTDPPIPRVINSTPIVTSSHNASARSNGNTPSFGSSEACNNVHSMPNNDAKSIEEEANVGCMGTLFGSSIKTHHSKPRTKKAGFINCNPLNISTSGEVDLDVDLPPHFVHPAQRRTNAFQCNGVRGPGKKFDYSCDKDPDYIKPNKESRRVESEIIDKPKTSRSKIVSNIANPKDDLQFNAIQNPEEKSEYKGNVGYIKSPRSSRGHNALPVLSSGYKKDIGSYSSEDAVSVHDSFEEQSYIVDTMSVMKVKIPCNMQKRDDNDATERPDNFNEGIKQFEQSCAISEDAHYPQEEIDTRANSKNERITETTFTAREQAELVKSGHPICNERIARVSTGFGTEDYPSFDEPAKPDIFGKIDVNQSKNKCVLTTSSSGGENRQRDANISPHIENISTSKRRDTGKTKVKSVITPVENTVTINSKIKRLHL